MNKYNPIITTNIYTHHFHIPVYNCKMLKRSHMCICRPVVLVKLHRSLVCSALANYGLVGWAASCVLASIIYHTSDIAIEKTFR